YVGITRARQRVYLCHAEQRRWYGKETQQNPSRFVREVPEALTQDVRARVNAKLRPKAPPALSPAAAMAAGGLQLRQRVHHAKFGEGVVLAIEGEGYHTRAQ
ncbi:MAG TPA: DNA helicase II, partial [Gammaproteobacteria bacterium]|nr:DNA helicase II [Gammaproteobacteria bacterium]